MTTSPRRAAVLIALGLAAPAAAQVAARGVVASPMGGVARAWSGALTDSPMLQELGLLRAYVFPKNAELAGYVSVPTDTMLRHLAPLVLALESEGLAADEFGRMAPAAQLERVRAALPRAKDLTLDYASALGRRAETLEGDEDEEAELVERYDYLLAAYPGFLNADARETADRELKGLVHRRHLAVFNRAQAEAARLVDRDAPVAEIRALSRQLGQGKYLGANAVLRASYLATTGGPSAAAQKAAVRLALKAAELESRNRRKDRATTAENVAGFLRTIGRIGSLSPYADVQSAAVNNLLDNDIAYLKGGAFGAVEFAKIDQARAIAVASRDRRVKTETISLLVREMETVPGSVAYETAGRAIDDIGRALDAAPRIPKAPSKQAVPRTDGKISAFVFLALLYGGGSVLAGALSHLYALVGLGAAVLALAFAVLRAAPKITPWYRKDD